MREIQINLPSKDRQSRVMAGRLSELERYCLPRQTVIITDGRVRDLYGRLFPPYMVVEMARGEQSKTLRTVEAIHEAFLEHGVDRSWLVVGIGGGIVCDVSGFAASTYLRGLTLAFAPTTLLAQVDASVGGKNGVNLKGYKNQIGVFSQPDFVLCDFTVLSTLPNEELGNGYAEVIKHALIADEKLFHFLEGNVHEALSLHPDTIERVIYDSLVIKAAIVRQDETEKGERRKLNFGHTIGHALEKACGLRHGQAISVGMALATRLSSRRGFLSENDVERIERLLRAFGLPVRASADPVSVREALWKDKKREDDRVHFVLLDRIGQARIETVDIRELYEVIDDLR